MTNAKENLKDYGWLSYSIERVLFWFRIPSEWLLGLGPDFREKFKDSRAAEKARSKRIESYLASWLLMDAVLVLATARGWAISSVLLWFIRALSSIRIIDIIQVVTNVALFDRLRSQQDRPLASSVRAVILLVVNYCELIVLFGLIYATALYNLSSTCGNVLSWSDAFYFSAITQLTVGYGDITPLHLAKGIAVFQALTGSLFLVIILATLVALLPTRQALLEDSNNAGGVSDGARKRA